jgi:CheY-like chemotaxis protein/anti-sigma regulatory factor (Ser/Thr protein kinase)
VDLHLEDVALVPFVRRVADLAQFQALSRGLKLQFEPYIRPNAVVSVDPTRLRQVLLNLLGNAAAYTDAGTITLRVVQEEIGQGSGRFNFSVSDTGVGIDAAELERIFEPFYQTAEAQKRGGGTGLGLSISQQIVELMGGQLQARSHPGQGSTFSFAIDLPLVAAAVSAESTPPTIHQRVLVGGVKPHILVVDDNAANRTVLRDMLQPLGFDVCLSDPVQAHQAARTCTPDAVITDLVMPTLDGYQLIQTLREQTATAYIPIIATSASVFPRDATRSLSTGADAFLPKPINLDDLLAILTDKLQLSWRTPANGVPLTEPPAEMTLPDRELLAQLLRCAREGDVVALRQHATKLRFQPPYAHFALRLESFLATYQIQQLTHWLDALISQATPTP